MTSLKDIYLHDVSIQYYTLENLGYKIKSANVVYLNNNYVRGDELDIKELFVIEDVTETIKLLQEAIPKNLQTFQTYLADKENEPNIDIGKDCKNSTQKWEIPMSKINASNIIYEDIEFPYLKIKTTKNKDIKYYENEILNDSLTQFVYPIYDYCFSKKEVKELILNLQKETKN